MQQLWIHADTPQALLAAFPARIGSEVHSILATLPETRLPSATPFTVNVQGEVLAIPYRVYSDEPNAALTRTLSKTQQMLLHCVYSRHCDGRVRQRHLEPVMDSLEPWVVPFVMQLAGEYVLEILETIQHRLGGLTGPGSAPRRLYGDFITRNPAFFARTERRVASYWTCYYRKDHPEFGTYPGGEVMQAFQAAASEVHGEPWPRNTHRRSRARSAGLRGLRRLGDWCRGEDSQRRRYRGLSWFPGVGLDPVGAAAAPPAGSGELY